MSFRRFATLASISLSLLAGCTAPEQGERQASTFSAINAADTVSFTGTEPFWGGEVADGTILYRSPENVDGTRLAVTRFAGNSGVSFSGELQGSSVDLMVTRGECSDGMSDRIYPFTATLKLGAEVRMGCAWTDRRPFEGPQTP